MGENQITDKKVLKLIEIIKKLLKNQGTIKGWYSTPYSEGRYDYTINYEVKKISLWKNKYGLECTYEGTIYVNVENMKVSFEDEWEKVYERDDLSDSVWEEVHDSIREEIESVLPQVCLDVDFSFHN